MSNRITSTAVLAFVFLAVSLPAAAQAPSLRKQAPVITHNTWTSGAAMPTALWAPGGVGVLKGQIYVVGGCTNSGVIVQKHVENTGRATAADPVCGLRSL